MYQTFSAGQSETYSSTNTSGLFRSNAVSATTTISDYSYSYSNGDTYNTSSSESGNVSGSGPNLSTNATFTLNEILTGYKGQSTTNEKAWYALPDLSISSLTSADYTTFSATYGESGSFSGPGTMTESVVSSSSFTLSLTNVDSTPAC